MAGSKGQVNWRGQEAAEVLCLRELTVSSPRLMVPTNFDAVTVRDILEGSSSYEVELEVV